MARDSFTSKAFVSPAARVSFFGVTVTSNPGTDTAAVKVAAEPVTLRTRRCRVVTPASLPTAIDAWLSSDPEIGVSVSNGGANCTPSPTMYCRYSFGVVG